MCGIVGAVASRNVVPILLEGLQRLEYRGYDSAGLAVVAPSATELHWCRQQGKVRDLVAALDVEPIEGNIGIAHTRWATHGKPCERNAHPQLSHRQLAVVHNGIIENHEALRVELEQMDYEFHSDTDSEAIAHLIHHLLQQSKKPLINVIQRLAERLQGAFSLGIIDYKEPQHMVAVRHGSPLVIGLGVKENFIASDPFALLPVTRRFIYLEEGDYADVQCDKVVIYDSSGAQVERLVHRLEISSEAESRGNYRHYMLKEIFEQPTSVRNTLNYALDTSEIRPDVFGQSAQSIFKKTKRILIVACGTSFHAGLVARIWLERFAGIPCQVEIASENRYRQVVVEPDTLFVTLSQSGETADTLAALRKAKELGYLSTLTICNVAESSLVRESDHHFFTQAGPEIGVASTKAFTTQLTALFLLTLCVAPDKNLPITEKNNLLQQLRQLPQDIEAILQLDEAIKALAMDFADKQHALFLGRGSQYPIAMEGALKLKELSYIHAEAYPAGELKHGPLALVDKEMPVIVVAPNDELFEKLKSNLFEVRARGGELYVFADKSLQFEPSKGIKILELPISSEIMAPMTYTIPLQLLAYHVAVLKGTDVDQPRNLAKSVTVE